MDAEVRVEMLAESEREYRSQMMEVELDAGI